MRLLADAATAARAGRGGLVMLRADPGAGTTALLEAHSAAMRDLGLRTYRVPVLPPHGSTTLSAGLPGWTEPAMVVVDDLHRADDATLLALHGLAEEVRDRALLLVTGRHRGVAPARFAGLDRLAIVHDLLPLDEDAARAVLAEAAGGEPSEDLLRLVDGAGGNPWLLTRLAEDDHAAAVTDWAAELAGDDLALLRFAAVLDEPTSVDELAAVSGLAPAEVLAGLGRLAALGLVEDKDGLPRLRQPMVRHAVATTSVGLRGPVAKVLASREVPLEVVAGQLAQLPVDAWAAWAVAWLTEHAGRLATRPTPAVVDVLDRAVAWFPPGDARQHAIRAALAEAQLWSGRLDEARRTATATLAARPDAHTRQRLRAALAQVSLVEMDPAGAVAVLDPERADGELTGLLAAVGAYASLLTGDLAGAARGVEQATPAAAENPIVEVALLHVQAIGRCVSRDLTGALELLDRSAALLDIEVADRVQWLLSRLLRAVVEDLRQDPVALDTVEQARPVARELGAGLLAWLHTVAALALFNNGRWDEALAEVSAAMAMPDQYGMAGALHGVAATILQRRGDLNGARVHAELADRAVGRGVAVFYEQITVLARALVADAEGDAQRALKLVRAIADGGVGVHHGHAVAAIGAPLVRIAVVGGDRELATRLVDQIRHWSNGDSLGEYGALVYCQGLVDDDVDVLLAAAKLFTEGGSPLAAARAAEDAARVLAASGRPADARATYQSAIDGYTALAADGDLHRADAALRAHGVRRGATGPRSRPKRGWASLTDAEYRVAELVARGSTNREVAAQLFVSVRTVHSHVSRVLAKLGYSSRIEIALKFEPRG
ncbi:helix-turn-helix transcriptional regulator [Amycolatopsis nigrescens]|uniref:helix-turn-helix transcriptional regulator n=1 Tax=Amycolatopsis nigrescens TaxID=381445 RepID=UPI000380A3FC|nr:LuxR C-terminal-related transcriptional regulator [Amycolatopsis nigrescens]